MISRSTNENSPADNFLFSMFHWCFFLDIKCDITRCSITVTSVSDFVIYRYKISNLFCKIFYFLLIVIQIQMCDYSLPISYHIQLKKWLCLWNNCSYNLKDWLSYFFNGYLLSLTNAVYFFHFKWNFQSDVRTSVIKWVSWLQWDLDTYVS